MKIIKNMKMISVTVVFSMLIILLNVGVFSFMKGSMDSNVKNVMGGTLYTNGYDKLVGLRDGPSVSDETYVERFLRPSCEKTMDKKYLFGKEGSQDIPQSFSLPGEVVRAYFEIVSDASNIGSKNGGCGSIGFDKAPYPMAYNLLSEDLKGSTPYEKFLKSFEGIGHINLLKLIEVPSIKAGDRINSRFFVEIEAIEGSDTPGKTYFVYYYGFVNAEQEGEKGWKISRIEVKPQDFLCHAYHGSRHEGSIIVDTLYGRELGIIEKVLNVEEDGDIKNVLAKGKDGKQYRFVFVRITNGADIEIRQCVMSEGKWKDIKIEMDENKYED